MDLFLLRVVSIFTAALHLAYIYIYMHVHTHIHIYIYTCIHTQVKYRRVRPCKVLIHSYAEPSVIGFNLNKFC